MKIFQVDAFTAEPFHGNPAGVCLVDGEALSESTMQAIAAEMSLSETAFVAYGADGYSIRWFTPKTEVPLCGHATLASAHILWETGAAPQDEPISFQSKSGALGARSVHGKIELDFPQMFVDSAPTNDLVNEAFGIAPVYIGKNDARYLIEIADADRLRSLNPDFNTLARCDRGAFMVTCRSDVARYDFLSRFFAPGVGINEDPVTGSAHCYLAPYWCDKLGKSIVTAYQASPRGGEMECEIVENRRVLLRGEAVTMLAGTFSL